MSSIEYEFDLAKTKFKTKERELIDTLDNARNVSKSRGGENVAEKFFALEETFKKVEAVSNIFLFLILKLFSLLNRNYKSNYKF